MCLSEGTLPTSSTSAAHDRYRCSSSVSVLISGSDSILTVGSLFSEGAGAASLSLGFGVGLSASAYKSSSSSIAGWLCGVVDCMDVAQAGGTSGGYDTTASGDTRDGGDARASEERATERRDRAAARSRHRNAAAEQSSIEHCLHGGTREFILQNRSTYAEAVDTEYKRWVVAGGRGGWRRCRCGCQAPVQVGWSKRFGDR